MKESLFTLAILAGGLATRLRPLTQGTPKSLIDIQGKPFIDHQLRLLAERGIERVILCVGYQAEKIQAVVRNGSAFGLRVEYSFDGPHLLGTAGAIKKALPIMGENFFALYGDSYLPCNYRKVQKTFQESGALALMTVFRNDGRWDKSNVEYVEGKILAYNKERQTPGMHHIDYGLGAFHRSAFTSVPEDRPYDLARVYQEILQQGKLAALEMKERFYEIGSLAGIEEIRTYIAAKSKPCMKRAGE